MRLELPWPPSGLSPNARHGHWASLRRAQKRYRHAAVILAIEAGAARAKLTGALRVRLTFCPPDRRSYDEDNLVARMKAGLDGVAQALDVDDSTFRLDRPAFAETKGKPGHVLVEIAEVG